jgi:D-arabinose 1-dehydrogenase-like Zn-dependent alcohol dehydrogenase
VQRLTQLQGGRENLCDDPLFPGYTLDGGFAIAKIAGARFAFPPARLGATLSSPHCSAPA